LDYYGVRHRPLPPLATPEAVAELDCVAAVSVTYFAIDHEQFAGLDSRTPDARIGYSIYVYDLRRRP
jgi:hypothetical protein